MISSISKMCYQLANVYQLAIPNSNTSDRNKIY